MRHENACLEVLRDTYWRFTQHPIETCIINWIKALWVAFIPFIKTLLGPLVQCHYIFITLYLLHVLYERNYIDLLYWHASCLLWFEHTQRYLWYGWQNIKLVTYLQGRFVSCTWPKQVPEWLNRRSAILVIWTQDQ